MNDSNKKHKCAVEGCSYASVKSSIEYNRNISNELVETQAKQSKAKLKQQLWPSNVNKALLLAASTVDAMRDKRQGQSHTGQKDSMRSTTGQNIAAISLSSCIIITY